MFTSAHSDFKRPSGKASRIVQPRDNDWTDPLGLWVLSDFDNKKHSVGDLTLFQRIPQSHPSLELFPLLELSMALGTTASILLDLRKWKSHFPSFIIHSFSGLLVGFVPGSGAMPNQIHLIPTLGVMILPFTPTLAWRRDPKPGGGPTALST